MFERLTESARRVMSLANQEAECCGREHVETEHILFGLIKEGSGIGAHVMKKFGIDLHTARLEVEKFDQAKPEPPIDHEHYIPRVHTIIENAVEEARHLHQNFVGTEHITLALLREDDGNAVAILRSMGVTPEDARREVLETIENGIPSGEG